MSVPPVGVSAFMADMSSSILDTLVSFTVVEKSPFALTSQIVSKTIFQDRSNCIKLDLSAFFFITRIVTDSNIREQSAVLFYVRSSKNTS